MLITTNKPMKYSDFKDVLFEKYDRKISAIKSNIRHCSLKEEDQKKLLADLASKLANDE